MALAIVLGHLHSLLRHELLSVSCCHGVARNRIKSETQVLLLGPPGVPSRPLGRGGVTHDDTVESLSSSG